MDSRKVTYDRKKNVVVVDDTLEEYSAIVTPDILKEYLASKAEKTDEYWVLENTGYFFKGNFYNAVLNSYQFTSEEYEAYLENEEWQSVLGFFSKVEESTFGELVTYICEIILDNVSGGPWSTFGAGLSVLTKREPFPGASIIE